MSLIHQTAKQLCELRKKIEALPSVTQNQVHQEADKLWERQYKAKPRTDVMDVVVEPDEEYEPLEKLEDDKDESQPQAEQPPQGFDQVI